MDDFTHERWLPVVGWEQFYEVSDLGRVRSLHPRCLGRILRPSYSNSGGYPLVILNANGQRVGRYVHDLMTEAFVGPRPPGQRIEVRHWDDDPRNNVLSNLVYGTSKQNKADMLRNSGHHFGNRDECKNGHQFTPENTKTRTATDGSFLARECKACKRDSETRRRARWRETAPPCSQSDCEERQFAAGLCQRHYTLSRPPRTRGA